jgi:hypothetical protein
VANAALQTVVTHGGLPLDTNHFPIQEASRILLTDGTTASPQTVSTTEIDLTVPAGAIAFAVESSGADLRVAIANGATATSYLIVRNGQHRRIPCAGMSTFHLLRNAAVDCSVSFYFEAIGL